MTKIFQRLTKASGRDRFKIAFGIIVVLVAAILAPIDFLMNLVAGLVVRTTGNKGFDDPVYKKNVQRPIEHNRQFENKE